MRAERAAGSFAQASSLREKFVRFLNWNARAAGLRERGGVHARAGPNGRLSMVSIQERGWWRLQRGACARPPKVGAKWSRMGEGGGRPLAGDRSSSLLSRPSKQLLPLRPPSLSAGRSPACATRLTHTAREPIR
jgi:hypothetical protein